VAANFSFNSSDQLPTESKYDIAPMVVRALITIALLACVALLAIVLLVTRTQQPGAFTAGLVSTFTFAALLVLAAAIATRGNVRLAVTVALGGMLFGATLFAWMSKLGIHTMLLGALGVTVLVAGVVSGMRVATVFAATSVVAVTGMYMAETHGVLRGAAAGAEVPSASRFITHLLLVATSLMFAWMLARIVRGSLAASQRQEQRFRSLFMYSPLSCVIHRAGRIELANDAAARLFGYASAEAMTGVGIATLASPAARSAVDALSDGEISSTSQAPRRGELRLRRRDGAEVVVDAHSMQIQQPDGPASLSVFLDLTDRQRTESQLARSETLLSRVFKASVDSIIVARVPSGRIELVNQGFSDLIGIPIADAHDRTTLELGIWHDRAERERFVTRLQEEGQLRDFAARMRRADGALRSVVLSSSIFHMDGAPYSVTIVRDVTQEQRDRLEYAAILDNALVGIAFTRNRRFQLANARFEAMFGWPRGEICGQPGETVWPSSDDYAEIGRIGSPLLARGQAVDFERQMRRRDGSLFWCHLRGRAVDSLNPADGGTIWIAEDVTQRRAADSALAAAKEAAEAASRAKSMFLANTSHEIRTPLNGVLGLARLALQPDVTPELGREYLQRIHDSAEALSAIITDILDLSKIEAGKVTLEHTAFDLRTLLDSVFAAYRELALVKGLSFELAVAADVPRHVAGDPTRVRQILGNFLSNAIKFTEHGRVSIEARKAGNELVRFSVSDSGIGVDATTRERLFSPFTQADASTTRRFGGTGLGLSICRQLAELMGGHVDMESQPGAGSRFWADLPLAAATAPAATESTAAAANEDLGGLRVLLVEDNPVNMLIAETLLRNWGVEVVQAHDGRQALAAVERDGRFDAVLMDVHMPVMSGHEATIELRKRHKKEELPIVALTAAALASEQQQSLAIGMNDFITKPFDAERLRSVLAEVTAPRRNSTPQT
jgi:PAS domain S-box-containing protein